MPVRVTDLHYVALAVPDLAAERAFFGETWGLVDAGERDGNVYFAAAASEHPFVIRLRADAEKKTDLIGFSAESKADVEAIFAQAAAAGAKPIAFLPGAPALNHIAFDVASIDELMRGLGRLTETGVTVKWDPGRHTAGNNTFSYYLTPNGNSVEYTSDLEEVDEATWQSQVYAMSPTITDQWGTGRIIPGNVPFAESKPDAGLWHVPA